MSKHDIVAGRIDQIERLENSTSGNPRYRITALDAISGQWAGCWVTAADHSFAYEIGNYGRREGSLVILTIGGRGTITNIETPAR